MRPNRKLISCRISGLGISFLLLCLLIMLGNSYMLKLAFRARAISSSSRRHFKLTPLRLFREGEDIIIEKTGEKGKVIRIGGSGWLDVRIFTEDGGTETNDKTLKIRKSAIKSISESVIDLGYQRMPSTNALEAESSKTSSGPIVHLIEPKLSHEKTRQWILFSDLHVRESSIDTCEKVLDIIHHTALENNAGVMFLGDFWHVRGSLNVELLNRVLRSLEKWTCPVILLPGNHDQVSLGGAVHALEPVQYAFPIEQVMMVSEPSIFMGALWIPYRRDTQLMKEILRVGSEHPQVNAIFCHADVRGAFMNDGMRCREGLEISEFPQKRLIFSGHFHKPHSMVKGGTTLRYLGSPYQTSLSEAGQKKYLYLLSCYPTQPESGSASGGGGAGSLGSRDWREEKRIPIAIGKKYFKVMSFQDPIIKSVGSGDRVVVNVRAGEDFQMQASKLREQGVEVDVREISEKIRGNLETEGGSLSSDAQAEAKDVTAPGDVVDLLPSELFFQYMNSSAATLQAATGSGVLAKDVDGVVDGNSVVDSEEALMMAVVAEGRDVLDRLCDSADSTFKQRVGKSVNLRIENVMIKDFGPYGGDEIQYPIANRGLVLIRGKSSDRTGADSNGAGKTTLAMSTMWGLTGSLDTRLVADGRAADVAYDAGKGKGKRVAAVTVKGTVNGDPFEVVRKRGAEGKKAELHFRVGDKVLTTQSVKDTQAEIDRVLGIAGGLLQRCSFFGQHSATLQALLGLTDVKLKNEFSALVDTELWVAAQADVRLRERKEKELMKEYLTQLKYREDEIDRRKLQQVTNENQMATVNLKLLQAREKLQDLLRAQPSELNGSDGGPTLQIELLSSVSLSERLEKEQKELKSHNTRLEKLRNQFLSQSQVKNEQLSGGRNEWSEIKEKLALSKGLLTSSKINFENAKNRQKQMEAQLKTAVSNSSVFSKSFLSVKASVSKSLEGVVDVDTQDPDEQTLETIKHHAEKYLTEYLSFENQYKTTSLSLDTLISSFDCHDHQSFASPTQIETDTGCPTCGQPLNDTAKRIRESELKAKKSSLLTQMEEVKGLSDKMKMMSTRYEKYLISFQEQISLRDRLNEVELEVDKASKELAIKQAEVTDLDVKSAAKAKELNELQLRLAAEEGSIKAELDEAVTVGRKRDKAIESLRMQIEEARKRESLASSEQGQLNATIAGLEATLESTRNVFHQQSETINQLKATLEDINQKRQESLWNATVYERLSSVFGPKGIQHFVFTGILRQLETIANGFLRVLSEGGIRLVLESDDDADRIVKSVVIRSSDGTYRERGLSQLSGGQWRRVSMALDLSFAEMVRRRGLLRCNVVVMDEILTHLDASGREAVGSVLRAMVEGAKLDEQDVWYENSHRSDGVEDAEGEIVNVGVDEDFGENITKSKKGRGKGPSTDISRDLLSGGAYETVLVILQDLAAVELEEAFDHIDIVVKASDVATVEIDGLHP